MQTFVVQEWVEATAFNRRLAATSDRPLQWRLLSWMWQSGAVVHTADSRQKVLLCYLRNLSQVQTTKLSCFFMEQGGESAVIIIGANMTPREQILDEMGLLDLIPKPEQTRHVSQRKPVTMKAAVYRLSDHDKARMIQALRIENEHLRFALQVNGEAVHAAREVLKR